MRVPPFEPLPGTDRAMRLRALRDGLIAAGWLITGFVLVVITSVTRSFGYDAYAYWSIDLNHPWARSMFNNFTLGGFRYTPPIALLFAPLGALPWWLFVWLWVALMLACLVFLGRRWTLALLALPPVALELYHGNVHLLIAVAVALGFRQPWTWSFVVLTKISPGVGLLWFAVRREWRSLAIAVGATAVFAALAAVVAPTYWPEFTDSIRSNLGSPTFGYDIPPPLIIRLPLAAVLVTWGARTDRPWTVAVAAMLGLPLIWPHGLAVALGAVPFLARGDRIAHRGQADWAAGARLRDFLAISGVVVGGALVVGLLIAGPIETLIETASRNLLPYVQAR
jgi:hypothetical protein